MRRLVYFFLGGFNRRRISLTSWFFSHFHILIFKWNVHFEFIHYVYKATVLLQYFCVVRFSVLTKGEQRCLSSPRLICFNFHMVLQRWCELKHALFGGVGVGGGGAGKKLERGPWKCLKVLEFHPEKGVWTLITFYTFYCVLLACWTQLSKPATGEVWPPAHWVTFHLTTYAFLFDRYAY